MPHAELVQFKEGFCQILEMEYLCCAYPDAVRSMLVLSEAFDITANLLLEMYVAKFSDQGSNNRTPEEALMLHFTDYVQDCAGVYVCVHVCVSVCVCV